MLNPGRLVSLGSLFVITLTAVLLARRVPAAPQSAGPPQVNWATPPVADQVLSAGLWRIDAGFQSTIQIYNRHIIQHRSVALVLYMADGTEYDLPVQDVAPHSTLAIDVGTALANAPAPVQGHVSTYGSAVLHFLARSAGGIGAAIRVLDPVNSLSFTYPFHSLDTSASSPQILDGLWWRRDSGVSGFLGLANGTSGPIQVTLSATGAAGTGTVPQTATLAGHGTQLLSLDQLVAGLPPNQTLMGGLHVTFTGKLSDVMVTGGLQNQAEGFSALIPFYPRSSQMNMGNMATTGPSTLASSGIMVGRPDPRMGFPAGTVFFPYAYLRNASSSPMQIARALYYNSAQGSGQQVALPSLTIVPGGTVQAPLDLGSVGLGGFNGEITETFSTTADPADLIIATGSADQTANYVFEVLPQAVATTQSKQDVFWETGNGWDTMTTLWNPGSAAEDLLISFSFQGGAGQYKLPIHLQPGALQSIDLNDLIHLGLPDSDGHVIPPTVPGGGMIISGPGGNYAEHINVVVSGGVFSVFGATCTPKCYVCGPPVESFSITPSPLNQAVGTTQSMVANVVLTDGSGLDATYFSTWSSGNTSVATVGTGGQVTAVAAGSTNIKAVYERYPADTYCGYDRCTPAVGYTATAQTTTQIPAADRIVSTLSSFQRTPSSGQACPVGQAGWYRQVLKIVTDQNGADIVLGGETLTEALSYTRNDFGLPAPQPQTGTSNSAGNYTDTLAFCTPGCPASTGEADLTQVISDVLPTNNQSYTLRPNSLVYKCSGVTVNGN